MNEFWSASTDCTFGFCNKNVLLSVSALPQPSRVFFIFVLVSSVPNEFLDLVSLSFYVLVRDGRSLLFLTPTSLLLRQIQLRLQSDSENFSNIILQLHSDSEIFKVWETNSDVKITFHPRVIFDFDFIIWYETPNPLRLQQINKERTSTPFRIRQKTPYSDSGFCPSLMLVLQFRVSRSCHFLNGNTSLACGFILGKSKTHIFPTCRTIT